VGSSGRTASRGALALEPPRTTRNTPEFIQNLSKKTLFFHFSGFRLRIPPKLIPAIKDELHAQAKPKSPECEFSRLNSQQAKKTSETDFGVKKCRRKKFEFSLLNSIFFENVSSGAELTFLTRFGVRRLIPNIVENSSGAGPTRIFGKKLDFNRMVQISSHRGSSMGWDRWVP